MQNKQAILIVSLLIAAIVGVLIWLYRKKSKPSATYEFPDFPDFPTIEGGNGATPKSMDDLKKQLATAGYEETSRTYRRIVGEAEVSTSGLNVTTAQLEEVYASTCPPSLYKVRYRDASGNYVTKTVLARNSTMAAASLGKIAGYNCFVSSMSGTTPSETYHSTGQLPTDTIVASPETMAQAKEEQAVVDAAKEADLVAVRAYTSLPRVDKMAVYSICHPPMSLSSSERERNAAFLAKDSSYVLEVKNKFRVYARIKGITCSC